MTDEEKSKSELISDLNVLRKRNEELETSEARLKLAEEAFWESEERFRVIVDNAYDGISISECDAANGGLRRHIIYCNDRFVELPGRPRSELRSCKSLDDFILPGITEEEHLVNLDRLEQRVPYRGVSSWKRPDGKENYFEWVSVPVTIKGKLYTIDIDRDITERRQIEKEHVQVERLSALGKMAAGISHNLNNILTGVIGPAHLVKLATENTEILDHVGIIINSAERATDLVKRLHLAVRGKEEESVEAVAVNQIIQRAVEAARPRWKDEAEAKGITVRLVFELKEVSPIRATRSRLHDILLNLLFNASDALPDGGVITIATEMSGSNVRIVFKDSGIGMDPETLHSIFEPFFTTKSHVGTGLGLYTVYSTISRWGGRISVESKPGEGTCFTMLLPAWKGETPDEEMEEISLQAIRPGKLLVVEDEKLVVRFLEELLAKQHSVVFARSGPEALSSFAAGKFDVALIDLGMPDMSGDQLARKIRQIDSQISTVLITGWELDEKDPRLAEFDFSLQKPLPNLAEIRNTIARAIELHDSRKDSSQ